MVPRIVRLCSLHRRWYLICPPLRAKNRRARAPRLFSQNLPSLSKRRYAFPLHSLCSHDLNGMTPHSPLSTDPRTQGVRLLVGFLMNHSRSLLLPYRMNARAPTSHSLPHDYPHSLHSLASLLRPWPRPPSPHCPTRQGRCPPVFDDTTKTMPSHTTKMLHSKTCTSTKSLSDGTSVVVRSILYIISNSCATYTRPGFLRYAFYDQSSVSYPPTFTTARALH